MIITCFSWIQLFVKCFSQVFQLSSKSIRITFNFARHYISLIKCSHIPTDSKSQDCQDDTMGLQCELCKPGYHGNATSPYGCMICACPLPRPSNNFASGCEVRETDGEEISCDCLEGYTGARCQSCAAGYYGRPEEVGKRKLMILFRCEPVY